MIKKLTVSVIALLLIPTLHAMTFPIDIANTAAACARSLQFDRFIRYNPVAPSGVIDVATIAPDQQATLSIILEGVPHGKIDFWFDVIDVHTHQVLGKVGAGYNTTGGLYLYPNTLGWHWNAQHSGFGLGCVQPSV